MRFKTKSIVLIIFCLLMGSLLSSIQAQDQKWSSLSIHVEGPGSLVVNHQIEVDEKHPYQEQMMVGQSYHIKIEEDYLLKKVQINDCLIEKKEWSEQIQEQPQKIEVVFSSIKKNQQEAYLKASQQWSEQLKQSQPKTSNRLKRSSERLSFSDIIGQPISGQALIDKGKSLIGIPYRWGAKDPKSNGLDCSGFVTWVYRMTLQTMWDSSTAVDGAFYFDYEASSTYRKAISLPQQADSGPGKYLYGGLPYFVDRYGLGSPGLENTTVWSIILRQGRAGSLFNRPVYYSAPIRSGTLPSDLDQWHAGDVVIWYADEKGEYCPGDGTDHMAIYMGDGKVIGAHGDVGVQIVPLTSLKAGGNSSTGGRSYRLFKMVNDEKRLQIVKKSLLPHISDGHASYSDMSQAEYGLYTDEATRNQIGVFKLNAKGESNVIESLQTGTYYIKELKAPWGYQKKEGVERIDLKEPFTQFIVKDEPLYQRVDWLIQKRDASTQQAIPLGQASLAGAQFRVNYYDHASDKGQLKRSWVFETDHQGRILMDEDHLISGDPLYLNAQKETILPLGKIEIIETKAPLGYQLNQQVVWYQIEPEKLQGPMIDQPLLTIDNQVKTGQFEITKMITLAQDSEPLSPELGARFVAVLESDYHQAHQDIQQALLLAKKRGQPMTYAELVTDKQGEAKSGLLAYGNYVVAQVKVGHYEFELTPLKEVFYFTVGDHTSTGRLADGRLIEAGVNKRVNFYINNVPFTSQLQLIKQDQQTHQEVVYNEASFQLYRLDGPLQLKRVKTDAHGLVMMKVGSHWQNEWSTKQEGKVELPQSLPSGRYEVREVKVPMGYLKMKPIQFSLQSQQVSERDEDGQPILRIICANPRPVGRIRVKKVFEKPENRGKDVVRFRLSTTQDIVNPADGKRLFKANQTIGLYELNEQDELVIDHLPLGLDQQNTYQLEEVETDRHYQLDTTKHLITLSASQTKRELTLHNRLIQLFTVASRKGQKEIIDVVSYRGLRSHQRYQLVGQLMDKKTHQPIGDPLKQEWVTESEKGHQILKFKIDPMLLMGKQVVVFERLYLNGQLISEHTDWNDAHQTVEFPLFAKVLFIKQKAGSHQILANARLRLSDHKGQVIEEWTSTKQAHEIAFLEVGQTYVLTELQAPKGYRLAKPLRFVVNAPSNLLQQVIMIDEPSPPTSYTASTFKWLLTLLMAGIGLKWLSHLKDN